MDENRLQEIRKEFDTHGVPNSAYLLITEIRSLRAENEALIKLMDEAMTNCETCRGEAVVSRMCARCQTFFRVTRG